MLPTKISRRSALAGVAAAAATPYFHNRASALDAETKAKNDRIPIGLIGAGGMGMGNMRSASKWVDVVAISDVDSNRAAKANEDLSGGKASLHHDYREILDNDDIKVVHIATPDHWHTKPVVEAMLAGKDIYCEKPLTLTIDEGKLIRKIQKQTGAIVQVGTQQRSTFPLFVKAMALVNEGRLGRINRVQAAVGGNGDSGPIPVVTPPASLDWERWLGPTPVVDYRLQKRCDRITAKPTATTSFVGGTSSPAAS